MAKEDITSYEIWIDCMMSILCITCAGLASGLTIGLVSIDHNQLRLMMINGSQKEKLQAKKILPLIKDHHWLLVTLLLFNAVANEALPIFLSGIIPESAAIIVATFSVLIFGEIIPSTIFSGRRQLQIASTLSGFVRVLMIIFYVIARPVGLFLDWWIGKRNENEVPFGPKDLYTLLSLSRGRSNSVVTDVEVLNPVHNSEHQLHQLHHHEHEHDNDTDHELGNHQPNDPLMLQNHLHHEGDDLLRGDIIHRAPEILLNPTLPSDNYVDPYSVRIAQRAIVYSREGLNNIIKKDWIVLNGNDEITVQWFEKVSKYNFSRYPVCNNVNEPIIGYLVMKELFHNLSHYLNNKLYVRDLPLHSILYFNNKISLIETLHIMQKTRSRIGIVTVDGNSSNEILGYFSVIDIVETILHEVHLDSEI